MGLDPPAHRTGVRRLAWRDPRVITEIARENESEGLYCHWLAGRLNGLTVKLDKDYCFYEGGGASFYSNSDLLGDLREQSWGDLDGWA